MFKVGGLKLYKKLIYYCVCIGILSKNKVNMLKLNKLYDYYMNFFDNHFNNIPKVIPSDEMCIRLAKQSRFDTSRKFKRFSFSLYTYNFDTDDAIKRGHTLLENDTRWQNKLIIAEIKRKNNEIKARNRELQRISREYFRLINPDLVYDFTRWDKVPRRIYEEAEYQYSLKTMSNPIIKWVLNN